MPYRNILVENRGRASWIVLNRPDRMNALDWETVKELRACFQEIDDDPGKLVAVIKGSGKAFSAGGDLKGYVELYRKPDDFRHFLREFHELLDLIERSAKITVAAVHGHCLAGGLELMLACDLVVADRAANIGDAHLEFGQLPGAGGSQRLPRAIGMLRAKDLILTGRTIDGREAERIGLVNRAVPAAELDAALDKLVAGLLSKSPAGLKGAKYLINEGLRGSLRDGLELELEYVHNYATTSHDATEGLRAFGEKRKPNFTGN